jgi:hypothetical protein
MPLRTRFRAEEVGFDTESFVWEMALDIVREALPATDLHGGGKPDEMAGRESRKHAAAREVS